MISFNVGTSKFNYRVAGIFIDEKNKRFLTNTAKNIDFVVLPGGRVEIGESSIESLKREMVEELGANISIVSLKAIIENFFNFDGYDYHELQYVYVAKFEDESIQNHTGEFIGIEAKDYYEWFSFEDLDKINYKPAMLKDAIKEALSGDLTFRHIIHKGNG